MDSAVPLVDPTHDQQPQQPQRPTTTKTTSRTQSQTAPWSNVPRLKIVGVEHPFIIQNIQKGIETLGGQNSIAKVSPLFTFSSRYEVRRD